jgi:carboxymethylenebutenolidase
MTDDAIDRDARAFIGWIDAQPQSSNAKMGVQGYCMGGALSFRTAAAIPDRIGAVGSFHGGGLATANPNSPHLLIERTNARYLVCVARNDDASDPKAKETLRETFGKTGRTATVEVYGGNHGWCVPDSAQYLQAEAERAWAALDATYKAALV